MFGIDPRLFALFLSLSDMNDINDLEELGLIKVESNRISLQPIVKDIAIADLVPSVNNCRKMLTNLQNISLHHGVDIPYYQTLFLYIEDVVTDIKNDDHEFYITFIEDASIGIDEYVGSANYGTDGASLWIITSGVEGIGRTLMDEEQYELEAGDLSEVSPG